MPKIKDRDVKKSNLLKTKKTYSKAFLKKLPQRTFYYIFPKVFYNYRY